MKERYKITFTSIKCCVDCICVPICMQKHENDLIHNCSIIKTEIKSMDVHIAKNSGISVSVDGLNRDLVIERGEEFLFVSCSPTDLCSTLFAINKIPVL